MRCSTRCSTATARACRASALSSAFVRHAAGAGGIRRDVHRCPLPIAALPQFASRLQPLALRESGQPTQLNIVTRRNSILSAAAHAFIDTLVRTLR